MMLVLSRKTGDAIVIDARITVTVREMRGNRARISIDAPGDVSILRAELIETRLDAWEQVDTGKANTRVHAVQ